MRSGYYYSYLRDEETKVQRGEAAHLKLHDQEAAEGDLNVLLIQIVIVCGVPGCLSLGREEVFL